MNRYAFVALLLLTGMSIAGCEARSRYHRGHGDGYGDRDDAWDIVRRDPCRYDEYRRFAAKHENPEKRRRVVEQLARDGCSRDRDIDRERRSYDYR
jgi:hypothetical protein